MHKLCYHFIITYNNITTTKYVNKHRYDNITHNIILYASHSKVKCFIIVNLRSADLSDTIIYRINSVLARTDWRIGAKMFLFPTCTLNLKKKARQTLRKRVNA